MRKLTDDEYELLKVTIFKEFTGEVVRRVFDRSNFEVAR